MTDLALKLLEDYVAECLPESGQDGSPFTVTLTYAQWRQITTALRREPGRLPSGEMVMVPREDLIRWASWFEEADSRIGPCWLGVKRDTSFKEAADEMRAHLGGTFKCPRCGVATPHQHNIDRKGNVMLSAAEASKEAK